MHVSDSQVTYHIVDAFTAQPFKGNPAAVVVINDQHIKLSTEKCQLIAREFNQPATAFVIHNGQMTPSKEGKSVAFDLRWFTPTGELPLCGHAPLAASKLLFSETFRYLLPPSVNSLIFNTLSGLLQADLLNDGRLQLSFPSGKTESVISSKDKIERILAESFGESVSIV